MAIPMKQRTFVGSGGTGMMMEVVVKDGVVGVALSAVSKAQGLLVLGVRFEWQIFQQRIGTPRISVPETGCSIILVVVIAVSL